MKLRIYCCLLVICTVLSARLPAATWQWDGGAGTGNWQTNTNWNPDTGNPNFNNTFADRLNVNGAQELIYSAAEGTTVYGTAGARGVVIGSGALGVGQMRITGGTFSTINADAEDVIGNSNTPGTSSLIVDGGNFISNLMRVGFGAANNQAILTVNNGTATFNSLTIGASTSSTSAGTVNLNGGTLTINTSLSKGTLSSGTLNFNGGTYRAGSATAGFSGLTRANVRNGGAVFNTNTFSITIAQPLLHSDIGGDNATDGGLTKNGAGSLTLTGANDYTGLTTVNAGVLVVGNNSALGTTGGATTVTSGSRVVLNNGITVAGEAITIAGNGNNGGGDTNFFGSLQAAGSATAAWNGSVTLGTLARVGAFNASSSLTLGGVIQNGASSSVEISGGGGTASGIGSGGVVLISGVSNTYTGNTNIIRGTLRIGANDALPVGTILDVDTANAAESATFDLNNFNQTVAALQRTNTSGGTGGSFVTNSGGNLRTLTVNQASNTTYSGRMTGTNLALTKSGVGNLTLTGVSGANDFAGPTNILGGTLTLSGSGNLTGTSAIGIATGAELDTTALAYVMSGSQPFTFDIDGAGAGSAGLLDAGSLNITSGVVSFNVAGVLDDPAYVFANYTSLTGAFFASAPAPVGYYIDYNYLGGNQIALVQIPEPSTLAMLAFGMISLWLFRKRN